MLNRLQELEVELEQERRNCEVKMKLLDDEHEKEKAEIKEDFATALQVNTFLRNKMNEFLTCLSVNVYDPELHGKL